MKYDIAIIGANGIQGKIVSRDLIENGYQVLLCALDDWGLEDLIAKPNADYTPINLKNPSRLEKVLNKSGAKLVVNCAVDDYNLLVTQLCLKLGMHYIDLGSEEKMTYDQLALSLEFKNKNLTAITGSGSTPGITNVMLKYLEPSFDSIETVKVGFAWSSNLPIFVPPFSLDAIDAEFSRPAKMLQNGSFVEKMPQDCQEEFDYPGLGKQKTFYTLHIEHHTFFEFLKNKGIKNINVYSSFPEHSYKTIKNLMSLGFTDRNYLDVQGNSVKPLEVSSEIINRLPIPENYKEKEVLWLKVVGLKDGQLKEDYMHSLVETIPGWEKATCNIDTGRPTALLAEMIIKQTIKDQGVFSPEFVVPPKEFFKGLSEKQIPIYHNHVRIN